MQKRVRKLSILLLFFKCHKLCRLWERNVKESKEKMYAIWVDEYAIPQNLKREVSGVMDTFTFANLPELVIAYVIIIVHNVWPMLAYKVNMIHTE